jgi:hypothetical protein
MLNIRTIIYLRFADKSNLKILPGEIPPSTVFPRTIVIVGKPGKGLDHGVTSL